MRPIDAEREIKGFHVLSLTARYLSFAVYKSIVVEAALLEDQHVSKTNLQATDGRGSA